MQAKELVSRRMRAVRRKNTAPEEALRKELRRNRLQYRSNQPLLPGKPDIVLTRYKIALFVDGDFWHGNQWKIRGYRSLKSQLERVSNKKYWLAKITRNIERDKRVNEELRQLGWKVIRFWESDLKLNISRCLNDVRKAIRSRRIR